MNYEFKVQKLPIQNVDASEKALNELGKKGFKFEFATVKDAFVFTILSKEKQAPGRPKKKAE